MDFDDNTRSDAEFIESMKDVLSDAIGEAIDELQDGFVNGMSDVVIFFRHNFKTMFEVSSGPEMAAMISGIGTDTVMNYITIGYKRYQENKSKRNQATKEEKKGEDVKMEEIEEEKDETT